MRETLLRVQVSTLGRPPYIRAYEAHHFFVLVRGSEIKALVRNILKLFGKTVKPFEDEILYMIATSKDDYCA